MSEELAILGGEKLFTASVERYNSIGKEEAEAARRVVESTVLSQFLGCWDPDFYGGPRVREFEAAWAEHFEVRYAVTVNSNTSGLMAAIGAVGVEPGDEVIVSPWTMCASATSILVWNAIPVFADIEDATFGLDPESIEKCITPFTKAIMVTNIFGHGARLDEIMNIARRNGLYVIEDNAQSPNARYRGRYTGTIADIGVFSLNYHKHIHTGEGGVCVTDNPELAERLQLIRNHAEAVVEGKGVTNLVNMIGFNFRMTEIEAAIGIEQLRRLSSLVRKKQAIAERLTQKIQGLAGLRLPVVEDNCTHVYCNYPVLVDLPVTGVSRDRIVMALRAEGVPGIADSYENLHMLPVFQKKCAYGSNGFPWMGGIYKGNVSYDRGICPVAESMNSERYMGVALGILDFNETTIDMVGESFQKVWRHLDSLQI